MSTPGINKSGGTQLYRRYRTEFRQYCRRNFKLRPDINATEWLNPGGGSVSKLTHEPRGSLAVLEQMLSPCIGGGQLTVLLQNKPTRASNPLHLHRAQSLSIRDPTPRLLPEA